MNNVIFLTFANSRDLPLPGLQEEEEYIYRYLTPRALKQHYLLHREPYAGISKIAEYIVLYREGLTVFHYSGHAGRDSLLLEDGKARSEGIARLLGQCPNLQLVVLNGCSSQGQVAALLEQGVPAVIATSAPVEDETAKRFSIRFYQALSEQASFEEAFDLAFGEVEALPAGAGIKMHRGFELPDKEPDAPLWGLFNREDKADILKKNLPSAPMRPAPKGYKANQRLIDTLWDSLGKYNENIRGLKKKEENGAIVSTSRKRMAILNSLPAPVAEHLRKLMVPVEDENEGYDNPTEARLRQMVWAYQIIAEMLAFTLLAQLWETYFQRGSLELASPNVEEILEFLHMKPEEHQSYDYVGLIRAIRQVLDQNVNDYFISELEDLKDMIYKEGPFQQGCFFMEVLRVKLNRHSVDPAEVEELCARAEDSLADILTHMAFLAKYTLTAIQDIEVKKFRHLQEAKFRHRVVYLRDLLGGLDVDYFELKRFTDNRSVLFMDEENMKELNLSPFIIDANAFEDDTDVSKIFFLSHVDEQRDRYVFKYVNKPEKKEDWIEIEGGSFDIIRIQLDAFKELLRPAGNA